MISLSSATWPIGISCEEGAPGHAPFAWQCGQYIDVMLPGERPPHPLARQSAARFRAARAACTPRAGREFSEQVFGGLSAGSLLRIEGPLGQFIYRPADPARIYIDSFDYAPI